jgi:CRISPR type I-E-associated protein CasB/Cse2
VTDRHPWVGPFVGRLTQLADPNNPNRAALAHLRRGLGRSPADTLGPIGWLFNGVPDDWQNKAQNAAILVAGLFAWSKGRCEQTSGVNFGRAFGCGLDDDGKKQREKRFTALLDTPATDLPPVLRQAVTLIEGTPLDWGLLVRHLMSWDHQDCCVQREWARGFWASRVDETADDEPTTETQTVSA